MNRHPCTSRTLIWQYLLLVPALALYVTAFWGSFGVAWPEPIRRSAGFLLRACWQCYRNHVAVGDNVLLHHRLVWMAVSIVFGGLLPLLAMGLLKRRPTDLGLGKPNRWGWRVIWIGLLVVVPLSLVFAWEQLSHQPTPRVNGLPILAQVLVIIGVSVPEHILLTGICVAVFLPGYRLPASCAPQTSLLGSSGLMSRTSSCGSDEIISDWFLPGGRLSNPMYLAPVKGSPLKRVLRWLGLTQPSVPKARLGKRLLAWWGLDGQSLGAIIASGMLFGIVHVGAQPIEFLTSFPGGIALGYLTYRSRSIWPGWLIHIAQMILVTLAMLLTGA